MNRDFISSQKRNIFTFLLALFFGLSPYWLVSADNQGMEADTNELKPRFGIFGGYNLNFHASDFKKLDNVPNCCPTFTSGDGTGIAIGALVDYPVDYKWHINGRVSYSVYNGLLSKVEETTVLVDGVSRQGEFEHTLDIGLSTLGFELGAGYRIIDYLFGHASVRAGFPMTKTYDQKEEIVNPSDRGTFLDSTRVRNVFSGDLENAAMQLAFNVGISYELPMNRRRSFLIAPEVFYSYWFTPVVSGKTWGVHTIRAGLSLKYKQPPPPPPPPPPPLDPPNPEKLPEPVKPPELNASVYAVKVDSSGKENKNFNIRIEDFISLNMRPLLNYVFFAEDSSNIPDRYIRLNAKDTAKFDLKKLQNLDAVQTYYQVLNIFGKRLNENPKERITLIGCNSNSGNEKGNKELSKARAESVRDYLRDVWGIDEKRMRISARNLPRQASRSDEEGPDAENRRVEIVSRGNVLGEPVMTTDTLRILSTTRLKFYPVANSAFGIKEWKLQAIQGKKVLKEFSGNGNIPASLDWVINQKDTNAPKNYANVSYTLSVSDSLGQKITTKKKWLSVEQITIDRKRLERKADKEFEYYSLILFDYGKSKLGREHRKVLNFVKNRFNGDASIVIYGYSDRIGDEDDNKKLSERRARSASRMLGIPNARVEGLGESQLLYDNDLPEGRFYCRTVRIEVITPVKEKE